MKYDALTFNGEHEIWDLHYNCLKDLVDHFIVVEFDTSFTGNIKPWYGEKVDWKKYPKATYVKHHEELYEKYFDEARRSQYTAGAEHWKREYAQKESLRDAFSQLNDEDMLIVGDVDEIWNGGITSASPLKLKLKVYAYYLDNRSDEEFWGPVIGEWGQMKSRSLNVIRNTAFKSDATWGWHFTSMGGIKEVRRKLNDSYTAESYNTREVQEALAQRVMIGRDYLGRPFNFRVSETEWPEYLKKNRNKYAHLCKGTQPSILSEHTRYQKRGAYNH